MNGERFDTDILEAFGYFFMILIMLSSQAETRFNGNRQRALNSTTAFVRRTIRSMSFSTACTCAFAHDFFHRAPEVDIKQIGMCHSFNNA
jgi:hypothetical protein